MYIAALLTTTLTSQCKIVCLRYEVTVSEKCRTPFRSREIYSDKERINVSLLLSSHLTVEQALDKAIRFPCSNFRTS